MSKPPGWRPTAYYWPLGWSRAFTAPAQLNPDGDPLREVESPIDSNGILLEGPWVLEAYDEKFGNAKYNRPDDWSEIASEHVFQLATGPDPVAAARILGHNVDQISIDRWRLRTTVTKQLIGIIHRTDAGYIGTSANGTPSTPLRTQTHPTLAAACEALNALA